MCRRGHELVIPRGQRGQHCPACRRYEERLQDERCRANARRLLRGDLSESEIESMINRRDRESWRIPG
jgi:hypothetical protein